MVFDRLHEIFPLLNGKISFSICCIVFAALAGIIAWNRLLPGLRLLVILCIVAFLVTLAATHWKSNGWLFNWYILIEFFLIIWTGKKLLIGKYVREIFMLMSMVYFVAWSGYLLIYGISRLAIPIFLLGCIMISVVYLMILFQTTLHGNIMGRKRIFILCSAILLYFTGVIPLFGMLNYLNDYDLELSRKLFLNINWGLSVSRYSLIAIFFISHIRLDRYDDSSKS